MKRTPQSTAQRRRYMVGRLLAAYAATDADTRATGRAWYPDAADTVAALATPAVPPVRAAAIVAALSPRERWRRNIQMAADVIARRPVTGLTISVRKAEAIRDGAPLTGEVGDALGGHAPKVRAFWRNLCGDGEGVTVDVWATRAATGNRRLAAPTSPQHYREIADAYRAAAKRVGERPCDFQAIVWLSVRPASEHTRDVNHVQEVLAA